MKKTKIIEAILKSVKARGHGALNSNDTDVLKTILSESLTQGVCKQVLVANNNSAVSSTREKFTEQDHNEGFVIHERNEELSKLGIAISIAIANFLTNNYRNQGDLGRFLATTDDTKKTFRDILVGKIKSAVDTHYKLETDSSADKKEVNVFDSIYAVVTKRLRTSSAPPSTATEASMAPRAKLTASSEPLLPTRAAAPTPDSSLSSSSASGTPTGDLHDPNHVFSSSAPLAAIFHR